jgi:hypothetical protein
MNTVHRVQLHYTLGRDAGDALIRNPLIDLLQAVAQHGSISARRARWACRIATCGASSNAGKTSWGSELITWEKGQSARLRVRHQAAVGRAPGAGPPGPQIEALRADLERAFAVAFDDAAMC